MDFSFGWYNVGNRPTKMTKRDEKFLAAVDDNRVEVFPQVVFEALKPFNDGGVPLSISLFTTELNLGKCYEKSSLLSLAFNKCRRYIGTVGGLRTLYGEKYARHAFVESGDDVYDTTIGCVYHGGIYWDIENPKLILTQNKSEIMNSPHICDVLNQPQKIIPENLRKIEKVVKNTSTMSTKVNQKMLLDEIEKLR